MEGRVTIKSSNDKKVPKSFKQKAESQKFEFFVAKCVCREGTSVPFSLFISSNVWLIFAIFDRIPFSFFCARHCMCCKRNSKRFVVSYNCIKTFNLSFNGDNIASYNAKVVQCLCYAWKKGMCFLPSTQKALVLFRTSQSITQQAYEASYITQMDVHGPLQNT